MRTAAVLPCVYHSGSMEKLLEDTVLPVFSFFFFPFYQEILLRKKLHRASEPAFKLQFRICLAGAPQPQLGQCPRMRVQASLHCPGPELAAHPGVSAGICPLVPQERAEHSHCAALFPLQLFQILRTVV